MSKGLHSHDIGFEIIESMNDKKLLFLDTSEYFEQPESPLIEITLPGFSKYFVIPYISNDVTIITSGSLGLTDILQRSDNSILPDGIYKIKQKICPYKYIWFVKYFLRTTIIDFQIKQLFNAFDELPNPTKEDIKLKKEITDIFIFIESAKADAELGHTERGQKDFQIAQKKVSKLLEKLTNYCN